MSAYGKGNSRNVLYAIELVSVGRRERTDDQTKYIPFHDTRSLECLRHEIWTGLVRAPLGLANVRRGPLKASQEHLDRV